jgi:hypothetical protein
MVDPNLLLRTWLLLPGPRTLPDGTVLDNPVLAVLADPANAPVVPYPITPVFAGQLPEGYDPKQTGQGMAIVVTVGGSGPTSGGTAHSEIPIIDPRMMVKVWAGNNEYQRARELDRAIFDWIHAKTPLDLGDVGYVIQCLNQVLGQDINDSKTGLATVVSFWHLTLREN